MKKSVIFFLIAVVVFVTACERSGDLVISDADSDIAAEYTDSEKLIGMETPPVPDLTETVTENIAIETTPVTTKAPEKKSPEIVTVNTPAVTESNTSENISFARPSENGVALTAQSLLGIPFENGGSTPDEGFDNSGFIHYVLKQNGFLSTPRRVSEQAEMGDKIHSMSELRSGDLVFFSTGGERAEYGGIYIGDGLMIYSPQPGETVKEQNIGNDYWISTFFVGVRVM